MNFSIVDSATEAFTDEVKAQIINLLGENIDKVSTAINVAIPAILSGLGKITANRRGAESLLKTVQTQDDSILDSLGEMLDSDSCASMIELETKVLGGLMGPDSVSVLSGEVAEYSDLEVKSGSVIVGIIAPVVMGVLKRSILAKHSALTMGGLTSLFDGQSAKIDSAIPESFYSALKSAGYYHSVSNNFTHGTGKTPGAEADRLSAATVDTAGVEVQRLPDAGQGGTSIFRKVIPLTVLAIIAWLAFQFFSSR